MTEVAFDYLNSSWSDTGFRAAEEGDRQTENLLLPVREEPEKNRELFSTYLGEAAADKLIGLMEDGVISGKYKEFNLLPGGDDHNGWRWVLLIGIGDLSKIRRDYRIHDRMRGVVAMGARHFRRKNLLGFATPHLGEPEISPERMGEVVAEGAILGTYRFERYKTEGHKKFDDERQIGTVTVLAGPDSHSGLEAGFQRGTVAARATCLSRNLVNTPASDLNPVTFAQAALEVAAATEGLSAKVLDEEDMAREHMNLHLAVGRGSQTPPRVVVFEWIPQGADAGYQLGLVGKGVTFDTGGLNIKPTGYMERMYGDMGGGAAVIGAMVAIARHQLPINVVGVVPMAENAVSGNSYRPSDIITSRKGITVEIANTDAEGRLLLADSLDYVCDKYAPEHLVDIATLTGSMRIALGTLASGYFVHGEEPDDEESLASQLLSCGRHTAEWTWRFPVDDDYKVQLASDVADIENCSTDRTAGAGAITAALFLREFVDFDKITSWAHIDIAATSLMQRMLVYTHAPYQAKEGATGVGARLLSELARRLSD